MATTDKHQITQDEFDEAARHFVTRNPRWKWRRREGFLEHRVAASGENGRDGFVVDYHIVYHVSFQVPCLFFVSYGSDGSDGGEHAGLALQRRGAVSQQMHPILQVPFWFVHPCDTTAMLDKIGGGKRLELSTYIETWLSLLGPFAGYKCELPSETTGL